MNLYVCGSSADLERVRKWLAQIQIFNCGEMTTAAEQGIHLTHNWVEVIEKHGANPPKADFFQRASWAADDLTGVREADVVWMLMPPTQSDGAMWEGGYADALGKELIVSGPGHERTIFTARAKCFDTDESAYDYLVDFYFNELQTEGRYAEP